MLSSQYSPESTWKGRFSRRQQSIIAPVKELVVVYAALLCYLETASSWGHSWGLLDLVELKDEIHHSVSILRVKIASFTTLHKKTRKDKKLK